MGHYRPFMIGGSYLICWLGLFFGMQKKQIPQGSETGPLAAAGAVICIISWSNRAGYALKQYDRIMAAEKMTVTGDGETKEVPLLFETEGTVGLRHSRTM